MIKKRDRILVTGACGLIGSYLIKRLLEKDITVTAFDTIATLNPAVRNKISPEEVKSKIDFITGNTENVEHVSNAIKNADFVFHFAARTFIPDSWKNPGEFYRTNIIGTANVLEACRENDCGITYISSYVYGAPRYLPIDERHPLQSYNPYSHSKILAEQVCDYYRDNYGLKMTVFRPFNIYGPGQNEVFLIPEILRQLMSYEKEKIIMNDLAPKRDYLYVNDLVEALVMSMKGGGGVYNIGSGYSVSVEEIIKLALKISGREKEFLSRNEKRENEIYDVVADISKAKKELKWSPRTSLEEGIRNCLEFYRNI